MFRLILSLVALATLAVEASAQCGARQVDNSNLILGQQLLSPNARAVTSASTVASCPTCPQSQQSLSFTAPAPRVQTFTLPQQEQRYALVQVPEPRQQVLYITQTQQAPMTTASASASASSSASAASTSTADFTALPLVDTTALELRQNSTACGGCGGRQSLIRQAFSGDRGPRRSRSRSVSRSFTSTSG